MALESQNPEKTKSMKPKRLGVFREVPNHSERRNPQSLRKALYDIVVSKYNRDCSKAASDFLIIREKKKKKKFGIEITGNVIYNIINDKSYINYAHLDYFAASLDVPVSLILMYSLFQANKSIKNHDDLNSLLKGWSTVLTDMNQILLQGREVSIKDFDRWRPTFLP